MRSCAAYGVEGLVVGFWQLCELRDGEPAVSPEVRVVCWATLMPGLLHSNGTPVVPFQERITRLVGARAAIGPAAPVVLQVLAAETPVRPQAASQFGVLAMITLPKVSKPRLLAVTRPVQPLVGL